MLWTRRVALACLITAVCYAAEEQSNPPAKPAQNPGFVHFFNNEYDEAVAYFEEQVRASPHDAAQYNHVAQAILYQELFRNGALESQLVSGSNPFLRRAKVEMTAERRARLLHCLAKAQDLSKRRLEANPRDVKALYELGVTHGLRANYSFLIEKAWTDALRGASEARKAHEQALEIDPNFIDANLIPAVTKYVVGSLPFYLRALGFLRGFRGDKEEGIERLRLVALNGKSNRYDAQVLLAVLYRRERKPELAIPLLESLAQQFPRNSLFRFEQVQMYSDRGDKQSALRVLANIEQLRQAKAPGYADIPAAKVQFVAGNLHFWYGDLDMALANFKVATKGTEELNLSMAVLAWLRLGQVYDLQGEREEAMVAYRETVRTAPDSDAASEAKNYMSNPYRRKRKDESGT